MKAEQRLLLKDIEEACKQNARFSRPGTLRLGTLYHYRDRAAASKKWRHLSGFRNINVCSGAKKWKVLAPRHLGPINVHGVAAVCLENVWTFSQVHPEDLREGRVRAEWYAHRDWGYGQVSKQRSIRYRKPLFWILGTEQLDELGFRRAYARMYVDLVTSLDEYRELRLLLKQGYNLQLFGYSAYDYAEQGKTLQEAFEDVEGKFGHELVLCGLLCDAPVWQT